MAVNRNSSHRLIEKYHLLQWSQHLYCNGVETAESKEEPMAQRVYGDDDHDNDPYCFEVFATLFSWRKCSHVTMDSAVAIAGSESTKRRTRSFLSSWNQQQPTHSPTTKSRAIGQLQSRLRQAGHHSWPPTTAISTSDGHVFFFLRENCSVNVRTTTWH